MLRINTFNKNGIKSFIKATYQGNHERKEIVQTTVWEIENFFSTENKEEWLVIEYLGDEKGIKNELSLLSINVKLKYFVEITLPEDYALEDALKIPEIIKDRNMYDDGVSTLNINIDVRLQPREIAIRLITPRHTYADMWSKNYSFK